MARKYYDEDEDEFIEGEWLDGGSGDNRWRNGAHPGKDRPGSFDNGGPGKTYSFRKKIVLSFDPVRGARIHDPYAGRGRGPGIGSSKAKFQFSGTEKRHLLFASLVLTTAFVIFLNGGFSASIFSGDRFPILISGALVAVLTGFLTHEMGHKFAAQKMGYWAEFRYSLRGLFLALFLSLLGVLIAAPGAVMIQGRLSKRENGLTSLAGPAINTVWATLFLGSTFVMSFMGVPESGLAWEILGTVVYYGFIINTIFAAFNLLPLSFLGLDGYKILAWNKTVYFLFAGVVGLYVLMVFGVIL